MTDTDVIVARIMRVRNGMIVDADANAIIRREIDALCGQTSPETERSAFIAAYPHLSMDEAPDAWGRPMFKHSHVQALWDGWFARACLDDRKSDLAQCSRQWQPIDTAPKDGTRIDLLYAYPRGRTINCEWRQGDVYGDGGWFWSSPRWEGGILLAEEQWSTNCYPNMEPTHWMPAVSDTSTDCEGK